MSEPFGVAVAVSAFALAFFHWVHHIVEEPAMSGDKWYMRQFAFGRQAISPPYCWRPLVPWLARYLGFKPVSYTAIFLGPLVAYGYAGGGWNGCAVAVAWVGTRYVFAFNVKNPEYAEGLGQLLFVSSLWAMSVNSLWAWPLLILAGLCRETLGVALGFIALFWNPWLMLPAVGSVAFAWLIRNEDKENRHPLVESSNLGTLKRWMRVKSANAISYAHTVQALRGTPFAVPFMWQQADAWARTGLIGFLPIWLLGLPASGQSRIFAYGFGLCIPFLAALPGEWAWTVALLQWFWPIDFGLYDEGGGKTFGYTK